jgi:hypothetical protein
MSGAEVDESLAVHTAARRYLIDRYAELTEAYAKLPNSGRTDDGYHYSDEAIRIFPRYRMVEAILFKVEELDSDGLPPRDELMRLLSTAGSEAQTVFTERASEPIRVQAIADEQRLFVDRVAQLARDSQVRDPLPYRRTLSESDAASWLYLLEQHWGVEGRQWHPMLPAPVPEGVLVLRADGMFEGGGESATRQSLTEMAVARVVEVREFREHSPDRIVAVEWLSPTYNGAEGLWTDESLSWIAYASHEGTVAFGGSIVPHLEAAWGGIDRWRWRAPQ